jgi:hypothetical protein
VREPDLIRDVTPEGDFVLAKGGLTALAGIRLPRETASGERSLAFLRGLIGHPVWVARSHDRDRWGRTLADLSLPDGSACSDLARHLVGGGLALWEPGTAGIVRPDLPALEAAARKRSLGLWAEARYKAIPVRQVDRMRAWIGRFVLVEGRVRSVGERQARTYLNFGSDWTRDFTIIIPKRTWSEMTVRGVTAAALKGRRIRARGVLEDWQGPALSVTVPETIEVIENERQRH